MRRRTPTGYHIAVAIIHVSEAEAARDFTALMDHVRTGEQVIIEENTLPIAVLRRAFHPHLRLLSESLEMAKGRDSVATLDSGFADDLEAVINAHREPLSCIWD